MAYRRQEEYKNRDVYNVYLKVVHTVLAYRLNNIEFDIIDIQIRDQVNQLIHK